MRKNVPLVVPYSDRENAKIINKCPCPGNQNLARKNDRPPLANIQDEIAPQKQYLTANYGLKVRVKSISNDKLPNKPVVASCPRSTSCSRKDNTTENRFLPSISKQSTTESFKGRQTISINSELTWHVTSSNHKLKAKSTEHLAVPSHSSVLAYSQNSTGPLKSSRCCSSASRVASKTSSSKTISGSHKSSRMVDHSLPRSNLFSTKNSELFDDKCVTLPDQQFVTLSQDTLKTTACNVVTELDSMTTTLAKVTFKRDSKMSMFENQAPFVNGVEFFNAIDQKRCSAVKLKSVPDLCVIQEPPKRRSNSVSSNQNEKIKPAVKTTLMKRRSLRKLEMFPLLYTPEYSDQIIQYLHNQRNAYILKGDWVNVLVDTSFRRKIIHWLLKISDRICPDMEPIFYMSVRLFDWAVVALKLRKDRYQLAAIVGLWISLKFLDSTIILKASKIVTLCEGLFTKRELHLMEHTLLQSVNFCLNIPDPLDFLVNYLKSSNLENDELLKLSSTFVMECATFFESYSVTETPFIAASALYLAYIQLHKANEVYVNFLWYNRKNVQHYALNVLKYNVKHVVVKKYEPFLKYSKADKAHVAKIFVDM